MVGQVVVWIELGAACGAIAARETSPADETK